MAEITVMASLAFKAAYLELVPQFEAASGHKVTTLWVPSVDMRTRLKQGEVVDLVIMSRGAIEELPAGVVAPNGITNLAKAGVGVAVKKGAPKPDISTPEAFKQALLNAKSIAWSDPAAGGASGVHFAKVIDRLGIADQVKAKTKHPPPSGNTANLVVAGEAELAVQQEPEVMSVAGVDMVGPLPGDLNNITIYAAGIGAGSQQSDAANALIRFLHTPEAQAVFKAKGLKPADAPKGT